ncbi:hypothetical protein AM1_1021 [Acaryochloris marina MBIC11017]|uniref:Uncharacterized protein n=1 Tax=Acaryochloris marina (strain MBIC 11017) TaxID=329726 RepID=B0C0T7_ACAM1|nr:hypothetical protein AM1_1021 [Acaryochloris marina MBIC11017]
MATTVALKTSIAEARTILQHNPILEISNAQAITVLRGQRLDPLLTENVGKS